MKIHVITADGSPDNPCMPMVDTIMTPQQLMVQSFLIAQKKISVTQNNVRVLQNIWSFRIDLGL